MVTQEREYYRSTLAKAKKALKGLFTVLPLERPITTLDIMGHYSFDYAQQVRELIKFTKLIVF